MDRSVHIGSPGRDSGNAGSVKPSSACRSKWSTKACTEASAQEVTEHGVSAIGGGIKDTGEESPKSRRHVRIPDATPPGGLNRLFSATFAATMVVTAVVALAAVAAAALILVSSEPAVAIPVGCSRCSWCACRVRRIRPVDPAAADGERDITAVAGRHHQGVRFRYAGRPYYWFTGFLTSMLLLMLGLAALFATSGAVAGIVFAVVIGAAAALLGWLLVTALRLAPGEVTVSPVGVFHRGLTFVRFVPCYAVDGVDARWLGSPAVWSRRTRPRTPGCATSPAGSTPAS